MAELDIAIVYRPRRKNSNADALSRSPLHNPMPSEEPEVEAATVTTEEATDHPELDDNLELNSESICRSSLPSFGQFP